LKPYENNHSSDPVLTYRCAAALVALQTVCQLFALAEDDGEVCSGLRPESERRKSFFFVVLL